MQQELLFDPFDVLELWAWVEDWSTITFGSDTERGPVGPLRHLQLEAAEAMSDPTDITEFADCLILLMDAARRAGHDWPHLVQAALDKMEVNRSREYPRPAGDDISQHVRGGE